MSLIDDLKELADRWEREALAMVPKEFADRGMARKYLRGDVHGGGMMDCAEELREVMENHGVDT